MVTLLLVYVQLRQFLPWFISTFSPLYLGLHLLVPRPRHGGRLLGVGGVLVPGAGVHLGVGGGEDDHVGHEDDHAGAEHRHDDRQDYVQLPVLLRVVI